MRPLTGSWLVPALEMWATIEATPRETRTKVYKTLSKKREVIVQTLRRQVAAAGYIKDHVAGLQISIDEVICSVMAVENLRRLEMRDKSRANLIREAVLLGKITAAGVFEDIEERVPAEGDLGDWRGVQLAVADAVATGPYFYSVSRGASAISAALNVDFDVFTTAGDEFAIFFTPKSKYSLLYKKSIDDQMAYIMASFAFFDRIFYFYSTENEYIYLNNMLKKANKKQKKKKDADTSNFYDISFLDIRILSEVA